MATTNPDGLVARVDRIEAENRRLKRGLGLLLLAVAAPLIIAAEKGGGGRVVEATKIVLRDASGKARAELSTQQDGSAALALLDEAGATVAKLSGMTSGPILEMAGGEGGSVWLTSSSTGASLSLAKGNGELALATNAAGQPSIKLQDREGKVIWNAP